MLTDPRVGKSTQVEYHAQDITLTNWSETTEVQQEVSTSLKGLTLKGRFWSPCGRQDVEQRRTEKSFEKENDFQLKIKKKNDKFSFEIVCVLSTIHEHFSKKLAFTSWETSQLE